jgi:AcrR family transcriptional regulator
MASHLSETAFRLFESQGYDAVSMEQVAAEADVAKATLYSYFPVKEALIAHRFREDIAAGMTGRAAALASYDTFDARMRYLLRESGVWHAARKAYLPAYIRFLVSQSSYAEAACDKTYDSGTLQILTHMFQAAQQTGEVTTVQTAGQIAWSFQYLLFGAVSAWLNDPASSLPERFIASFDLVMHGVAARPAEAPQRHSSKSRSSRGGVR